MRILMYIGILLQAAACTTPAPELQTGDLIAFAGEKSRMNDAITSATGGKDHLDYSHIGIAIVQNRADSVLEATSEGGVRMTSLADFLARAARIEGRPAAIALRLRDTTGVARAVERARKLLGSPYDYSFHPDNGRYYCSELVWETYLTSDGSPIFPTRPMNFRAADGTMPAFWIELFDRLGESIPEGLPGTNPNDMARDPQLKCIGRYY